MKGVVDRFSEEFVETRRKALDKFLKRVADHPVLSFNEHFNAFLSAKVLKYFYTTTVLNTVRKLYKGPVYTYLYLLP